MLPFIPDTIHLSDLVRRLRSIFLLRKSRGLRIHFLLRRSDGAWEEQWTISSMRPLVERNVATALSLAIAIESINWITYKPHLRRASLPVLEPHVEKENSV